jgi:hypothetical protein
MPEHRNLMCESIVVPRKVENEFGNCKRETYLPDIHMEEADDNDDDEAAA